MVAVVLPSGSGPLGIFEGMALRPNDAIVLLAGDGRSLRSPSDFRACTVSVPRASLESALWHYAHHELSTLVPESRSFAFSPKRVLELAGTICSLTSASPGPVGLIALAELEDRLLQSLAGEFCRQPLGLERHSGLNGRADHVRRARDYIEAHLKQPIPLSQVAVDAGVSIRTLELAFREVLGVTPLEYILTRRLNRVRQHLLDKGRVMGTLADLAVEYGLFHLGRFSREYKALFGELPSETLVRSRR
jgi:AraC family ethanolamine operon transcriptional activator